MKNGAEGPLDLDSLRSQSESRQRHYNHRGITDKTWW